MLYDERARQNTILDMSIECVSAFFSFFVLLFGIDRGGGGDAECLRSTLCDFYARTIYKVMLQLAR